MVTNDSHSRHTYDLPVRLTDSLTGLQPQPYDPSRVRRSLTRLRRILPAAITVLSLFCGFDSILYASSHLLVPACLAIGASIVCDSLDGWLARKLKVSSKTGTELDSLADIVAFGIAPAFLVYRWVFPSGPGPFGLLAAICLLATLAYVASAAGRLARFNISASGRRDFTGLPTTAAAGAVAALVGFHTRMHPVWPVPLAGVTILFTLAGLMISHIEYADIRRIGRTPHPIGRYAPAAFIALTCYCPAAGLLSLASAYTASGPLASILKGRRS